MPKFGYRPSHKFHALRACIAPLSEITIAPAMDLLKYYPGLREQGQEGCCTGFGESGMREMKWGAVHDSVIPFRLSPAYLYAKARQAEHTFPLDAGATLADGFAVLQADGVCPEEDLPYLTDPAEAPTLECDLKAQAWRITDPVMVHPGRADIQRMLMHRCPIAVSMPVYPSFEQGGVKGVIPMPQPGEQALGGHCWLMLGYDEKTMLGANWWGRSWGDSGFFHLPWGYEALFWEAMTDMGGAT